jgi:hypothetical protein
LACSYRLLDLLELCVELRYVLQARLPVPRALGLNLGGRADVLAYLKTAGKAWRQGASLSESAKQSQLFVYGLCDTLREAAVAKQSMHWVLYTHPTSLHWSLMAGRILTSVFLAAAHLTLNPAPCLL